MTHMDADNVVPSNLNGHTANGGTPAVNQGASAAGDDRSEVATHEEAGDRMHLAQRLQPGTDDAGLRKTRTARDRSGASRTESEVGTTGSRAPRSAPMDSIPAPSLPVEHAAADVVFETARVRVE